MIDNNIFLIIAIIFSYIYFKLYKFFYDNLELSKIEKEKEKIKSNNQEFEKIASYCVGLLKDIIVFPTFCYLRLTIDIYNLTNNQKLYIKIILMNSLSFYIFDTVFIYRSKKIIDKHHIATLMSLLLFFYFDNHYKVLFNMFYTGQLIGLLGYIFFILKYYKKFIIFTEIFGFFFCFIFMYVRLEIFELWRYAYYNSPFYFYIFIFFICILISLYKYINLY